MIRFKVVRASKLLLIFSIVVLVAVIGVLAFKFATSPKDTRPAASLVETDTARTQTVFAVSQSDENDDKLSLDPGNSTDQIEIEILPENADSDESRDDISVLIYHTHTHEAYDQVSGDPYVAVEAWRTTDTDHSVVRVGEELARQLRSYGFTVVHDTTDHEGTELSTAYNRSLDTLERFTESFDLYIDLHRDAYYQGLEMRRESSDGESMAQLMMLVGNGNGFDEKPYYTENYIFAKKLTQRINAICPNLCRDVLVKDGRYNQHIGVFSVLVEVGHNLNTLAEALNSISPLAEGIYDLLYANPDIQLEAMQETYKSSAA